jgi:protein-S-isoprenylcysteine O-methyltransferase Ste14
MRDSAIISLVVGAVSFLTHVLIDPRLRKDAVAKSIKTTEHDEGTSRAIQVVFLLSWLLLLLTALPNQFQIGVVEPHLLFTALGIVLAAGGFLIRVVAMRTLGEFFTRTLRIREKHRVISEGIYRRVRHPGYLGTILFFVGSGIATANFITTLLILAAILPTFVRRIAVEERMLTDQLGKDYSEYKAKTWKLIPFVF